MMTMLRSATRRAPDSQNGGAQPAANGGAQPAAQNWLGRRLGLGRGSADHQPQAPSHQSASGHRDARALPGSGAQRSAAPADGAAGSLQAAIRSGLEPALAGPLFLPGDSGFDEECAGHNLAIRHQPLLAVGATGPADVMRAVEFATTHGLPVGVLCTGHGASVPADGALLISTKRMQGVRVDPFARVAFVTAGARWEQVIHETAPFGLAPASGSSTQAGAVGYTLGGGLPLLGRSLGYAADHVRSIDVVTAYGTLRQATAGQYADLFWALRGGQGNFGVVTSMEIGLFPIATIYGGGLYFRGSDAPAVLNAYRRWLRAVPDEMASSIALTRYPWHAGMGEDLRGRFVVHVRIAFNGSATDGERIVRPLREAARTVRDTVTELPYSASDTIHSDPVQPFQYYEHTTCLASFDEDAVDALADVAGPDSTCPLELVELRHLGGALAREASVPSAAGGREAAFLLYAVGAGDEASRERVTGYADRVMTQMAPWSTGQACLNFLGAENADAPGARTAFAPEDYRRLASVKRRYDPENMFRICHNIPPA